MVRPGECCAGRYQGALCARTNLISRSMSCHDALDFSPAHSLSPSSRLLSGAVQHIKKNYKQNQFQNSILHRVDWLLLADAYSSGNFKYGIIMFRYPECSANCGQLYNKTSSHTS